MTDKYETLETLSGSRKVDFTSPVFETMALVQKIKADFGQTKSKAAKAYLEEVENQFRQQMVFLYKAAELAYPEDKIDSRHAWSSLGPDSLFMKYEFDVYVKRKEETA
jgi:hypothetical protein